MLIAAVGSGPGAALGQEARDTVPGTAETPDSVAFQLEQLIVTAHRIPLPAEKVAPRVTVLTGEELRAHGFHFVSDALRQVAGISMIQGGSFGSLSSLFLRGGESDYVRVLVDGVPVNEPGGSYDFANLTADNVERIEVLRGPGSVLYGSDAMTGVVQIFTRRGRGAPRVEGGVRGGTLGTLAWDAAVMGGTERVHYSAGASRLSSDGLIDLNNEYRDLAVSGRVEVAPDERTEASVSLRYTDAEFHFPTDGAGRVSDANQLQLRKELSLGIEGGRRLTRRLEARLRASIEAGELKIDDPPDGPADTLGFFAFASTQDVDRRLGELRLHYHLGPTAIVTVGGELEEEELRSTNRSDSEFGPSSGELGAARTNRAVYVQALADPAPRLSASLGLRLDDNEEFGSFGTYRASAVYRLPAGVRLRGSYGIGFKEPTFFENFAQGFVLGNPRLDPERSRSWEIGADYGVSRNRFQLAATYFDQRFRDLIQFAFTPPEPGASNFFNVGAADADGMEIEARVEPTTGLFLESSYTYLRTRVVDAGLEEGPGAAFVQGRRLLRRAAHTVSAALAYRERRGGALTLAVRGIGRRDDLDFSGFPAERVRLPTYVTVDLAASWPLVRAPNGAAKLAPTLRVENLLNHSYEELANFPARRRTIFAGARALLSP